MLLPTAIPPSCLPRRASITLVCKRWERLFFSEPALWRRFLLRPAKRSFSGHDASLRPEPWGSWCAAKHRQLARVAGLVEVFEAGARAMDFGYMAQCAHNSGWRLEQFVGLLRPELLTEALLYWDMWELSGLLHFPRLTRLLLHDSEDLRCCVGCPSCAAWVCTPTTCQARA